MTQLLREWIQAHRPATMEEKWHLQSFLLAPLGESGILIDLKPGSSDPG